MEFILYISTMKALIETIVEGIMAILFGIAMVTATLISIILVSPIWLITKCLDLCKKK